MAEAYIPESTLEVGERKGKRRSAAKCKTSRSNAKRALTNYIKIIINHIRSDGSRTLLKFHRSHLASLSVDCATQHSEYVLALKLNEEERFRADSWLLEVDIATTNTMQEIDNYLERRKDDVASSHVPSEASFILHQSKEVNEPHQDQSSQQGDIEEEEENDGEQDGKGVVGRRDYDWLAETAKAYYVNNPSRNPPSYRSVEPLRKETVRLKQKFGSFKDPQHRMKPHKETRFNSLEQLEFDLEKCALSSSSSSLSSRHSSPRSHRHSREPSFHRESSSHRHSHTKRRSGEKERHRSSSTKRRHHSHSRERRSRHHSSRSDTKRRHSPRRSGSGRRYSSPYSSISSSYRRRRRHSPRRSDSRERRYSSSSSRSSSNDRSSHDSYRRSGSRHSSGRRGNQSISSDWIARRENRGMSRSTSDAMISLLPKHQITPFNGDPMEWPHFIAAFKDLVHDVVRSDSQRLSILRGLLTPEVRSEIGNTLTSPEMYWAFLEELEENYGHPHMVARSYMDDLLSTSAVPEGDRTGLTIFIRKVKGAVKMLKTNGYGRELESGVTLGQLVAKLPKSIQSRWGRYSYDKLPRIVNILDLERWLHKIAMGEKMVSNPKPSAPSIPKGKQERQTKGPSKPKPSPARPPTILSTTTPPAADSTQSSCFVCGDQHNIFRCAVFKAMDSPARQQLVKEKRRCFSCLSGTHQIAACRSKNNCKIDNCGQRHHTLLHSSRVPPQQDNSSTMQRPISPAADNNTSFNALKSPVINAVLLAVLKVRLAANGKFVDTYGLLDPGSEGSLIRQDIADQLELKRTLSPTQLGTFHGRDPIIQSGIVNFELTAPGMETVFQVKAYTTPELNIRTRRSEWKADPERWSYLNGIHCPDVNDSQVTVLIGMNVVAAHLQLETRSPPAGQDGPHAIRTQLGWCLIGPISSKPERRVQFPNAESPAPQFNYCTADNILQDLVHQSMKLEAMGVKYENASLLSVEEQRAIDIVERTTRFTGERYEAGLPWKEDDISLPSNREVALRMLLSVEKRNARDPAYAARYNDIMMDSVQGGFAREVSKEELAIQHPREWYITHHGVRHPHKPGNLRVVFNGSFEYKGVSLNKSLLPGPNLLNDLIACLTRFRQRPIAVTADIAKMFYQVGVMKSDQPSLRYLWRTPGSQGPPHTFQMMVQPFGAVSSPFVCTYILRRAAKDFSLSFPEAAERILSNFYVDNYLDSFNTVEEAAVVCQQLMELHRKAGFHLTQWLSSSRELLARLPSSDWIAPHLDLDLDKLPVERTLGVMYDAEEDCFFFKVRANKEANTKRSILSEVSSIHDPFGCLSPAVIPVRYLLQQIWISGTDWDEPVHPDLFEIWRNWVDDIPSVQQLKIPRPFSPHKIVAVEIHTFADASEKAFGAVIYLRFKPEGDAGTEVSFVASKARVAPVKPKTIPRLELQAALLAFRLTDTFRRQLQFEITKVIYWSDSQTVLQWISSKKCKFHPFVGNRVGEIREGSNAKQWRHVPGKENPADDCSRGILPSTLTTNHRWFKGPAFLQESPDCWPTPKDFQEPTEEDPEIKVITWIGSLSSPSPLPLTDLIQKSSDLHKLRRIVAWILRYFHNIRQSPKPAQERRSGRLSVVELRSSLNVCIKLAQEESFPEEMYLLKKNLPIPRSSSLLSVTPYIDEEGALRVGGRLGRSPQKFETNHPLILPGHHKVTTLIIQQYHKAFLHATTERLLGEIRSRYWIQHPKRTVRRCIRNCLVCRKQRAEPQVPFMADLPPERLTPFLPPFTNVGVDYFGPLFVTVGRRTEKRYGCLFTCLATRAVHIELAHSLSTDSFLCAFRRFISVRGRPSTVFSDNGSNFVAAEKELGDCLREWNLQCIEDYMAANETEWRFIPPYTPHFGGIWERLVKSFKSGLRFVLQNQTVSEEILFTVLKEIEAVLNGRPLTDVPVDPEDPSPLTPFHFLLLRPQPNIPPAVVTPEEKLSKRRWKFAQQIVNDFWRRWMREYVPNLIGRRKWTTARRNLQQNDLVLVVDPSSPRGHWPLGRVIKPLPGPDGVVRAALVKTQAGERVRSVAKLCLLLETTPEEKEDPPTINLLTLC